MGKMNTMDKNINHILAHQAGYPIEEMEALVRMGQEAVGLVASAIREHKNSEEVDLLPLIVVLGEIHSLDTAPILLDLITIPGGTLYQEAAIDAVAKLGDAAMPFLLPMIEPDQTPETRFWALSALGLTKSRAAIEPLREALETMPDLAGVTACALMDIGDKDSIKDIYAVYERLAETDLWIPDMQEAIQGLAGALELGEKDFRMKDWRTRWRRRPAWDWVPEPGLCRVAFLMWDQFRKGKWPPRKSKKKTFAELILKREPFPEGKEEKVCERCGHDVFKPLGLPVCPETAYGSTIHQEAALQAEIKDGAGKIAKSLDWMDFELLEEEDGWNKLADDDKERWVMDQTTLEFLLLDGCRTLDEGVARIREVRYGLGRLWGLPQEEMHNKDLLMKEFFAKAGKPIPKNKTGRNEPCPCDSGKKFKKCCGGRIV